LRWGVMEENDKYKYIGIFNGNQKEGKGILINKFNIIVGEYKNDRVGYTYNKNLEKLNMYNYVDGEKKEMEQSFIIRRKFKRWF